jgi:hypothetical protein
MHAASEMLRSFESALDERFIDDHLGGDVRQFPFSARLPPAFALAQKFRCIRSTPTELESMSENDFECLASTGLKSPANAMFEHIKNRRSKFLTSRSWQTCVVQSS